MKRFRLRDALVMSLPAIVLAGLGFSMRNRKPAVWKLSGPFMPYIKHVRFAPVNAEEVLDGYDTKVIVEFGAGERKPPWWDTGFVGRRGSTESKLVCKLNKSVRALKRQPYSWAPFRNKNGVWEAEYRMKLADIPVNAGEIRLRDRMQFQNDAGKTLTSLRLDTPVRSYGVATKIPAVSRIPQTKLEKFSFEPAPPIKYRGDRSYWRVRWSFQKQISRAEAEKTNLLVDIDSKIVDKKGNDLHASMSGSTDFEVQPQGSLRDPLQAAFIADYHLESGMFDKPLAPTEPLYLEGIIRWNNTWPLVVKIPIRDANGTMLFSSRRVKPMFRVVSIGVKRATTSETAKTGTDTQVDIRLKALNSKVDLSNWKWDLNFSQRVETAKGAAIWDFPFNIGKTASKGTIKSGEDNQSLILSYSLILSSIPESAGKLTFKAEISANGCRRVPVSIVVRP